MKAFSRILFLIAVCFCVGAHVSYADKFDYYNDDKDYVCVERFKAAFTYIDKSSVKVLKHDASSAEISAEYLVVNPDDNRILNKSCHRYKFDYDKNSVTAFYNESENGKQIELNAFDLKRLAAEAAHAVAFNEPFFGRFYVKENDDSRPFILPEFYERLGTDIVPTFEYCAEEK